ncbi:multiple cyclophane-containing RiPP AmcA [Promicromonospora sp. NPDC060204]|uniref:multiple cyclophane-containing RiPP AmcA n=1 Tax=unclassified Promicromonospora TaxID=2647929 RepID=UPI0036572ECB
MSRATERTKSLLAKLVESNHEVVTALTGARRHEAEWDNRPSWDNWKKTPGPWDNRPSWDNWKKR